MLKIKSFFLLNLLKRVSLILVADPKNRELPVEFDGQTFLQYPNEITVP